MSLCIYLWRSCSSIYTKIWVFNCPSRWATYSQLLQTSRNAACEDWAGSLHKVGIDDAGDGKHACRCGSSCRSSMRNICLGCDGRRRASLSITAASRNRPASSSAQKMRKRTALLLCNRAYGTASGWLVVTGHKGKSCAGESLSCNAASSIMHSSSSFLWVCSRSDGYGKEAVRICCMSLTPLRAKASPRWTNTFRTDAGSLRVHNSAFLVLLHVPEASKGSVALNFFSSTSRGIHTCDITGKGEGEGVWGGDVRGDVAILPPP